MELPVINNTAPEASKGGCSAGSCGSTEDQMGHLPEHIREKVFNHPCYSEEAHHYFARMHVAVAPACNIQCHYCNRKYDCANESRPGVVSELHQPEQAVKKVLAVAANIPQMTVLGIAGPAIHWPTRNAPLPHSAHWLNRRRTSSCVYPPTVCRCPTMSMNWPSTTSTMSPSPLTVSIPMWAQRSTRGSSGRIGASRDAKLRRS